MEIDSSHLNDNTDFNKCIHEKKDLQQHLLDYLEAVDDENNEIFLSLIHTINEQQLSLKNDYLIEFLHLLATISNNHYRYDSFHQKIEKIINFLKNDIKNNLSEQILFNIFKNNKKILLFLFDEKIITPTKIIADKLSKQKTFISYFYPELKQLKKKPKENKERRRFFFYQKDEKNEEEEEEIDEEKRKIGENENKICYFIRNDLIKEFIMHVTKNNYSLQSIIKPSIYETNPFLINKKSTLIEYSVFFGSIQIIKYLLMNKIELTNSLWMYAIHGNQPEVIHLLEEFHIQPENDNYEECFIESIKCHHNQIADYIKLNYLNDDFKIKSKHLLKYFNYAYFDELDFSNESLIYYLCKYDYPSFIKYLIQPNSINNKHSITEKIKNKEGYSYKYQYIENNKTLLFIATKKENYEIVKYLLSFPEINVNEISSEKLWMHKNFVKNNINENDINWWKNELYDFNIEEEDENRYEHIKESTPLYIAVKKENIGIVKLLLSNPKIDLNIKSITKKWYFKHEERRRFGDESTKEEENTALYISIKKENIDILKLLLSHQNLNINEKSIQKLSCIDTERFIWKYFDGSEEEITPLSSSIRNNNDEIIKLLLSHNKVDVKIKLKEINFYIKYKSKDENYQIHNFLVQKRIKEIDEDYKNNSSDKININYYSTSKCEIEKEAFHIAIKEGNLNAVQFLLSSKEINVNSNLNYRKNNNNKKTKSPLFLALSYGNLKIFNFLYPISKIDINKKYGYNEETLLHLATIKDNLEIVQLLLSVPEIDVNSISTEGKTALHIATIHNNLEIAKLLLSMPEIDVNSISTEGETALHTAAIHDNLEIAKLFLSRPEININAVLKGKGTVLHIITGKKIDKEKSNEYNNFLEILKLLLSNPTIDVNAYLIESFNDENKKKTALHLAVMNENLDFLELLLSHPNIDINSIYEKSSQQKVIKRKTALHIAVQKGNLDIFLLLIKQPNIDIKIKCLYKNQESTLLYLVAECKKLHDPEYLLKKYSFTSSQIEEYNSIKNNYLELFNFLLSLPDFDINEKAVFSQDNKNIEQALLNIIVENGIVSFVKSLLSQPNLDINSKKIIKSNNKVILSMTSLHCAIENFVFEKFVENWMRQAISISSFDKFLYENIDKENIEIIKLLLSHPNIDINEKYIQINDDREEIVSALHLAVDKGYTEIVQLLLSHPNIDVNNTANIKTSDNEINGMTALHKAVSNGKIEIVELLLSHPKINVILQMTSRSKNSSNIIRLTPLDLAMTKNNQEIIDLLNRYQKRSSSNCTN